MIQQTINLDLQSIGSVPHITQWLGPWAMLPDHVHALSELIRGVDISQHLAAVEAQSRSGGDDEYYGYHTELIDGIAHVSIRGTLMKHQASLSSATSTAMARRDIRQAAADPNVRGIMLAIDSPGGTVAGTRELANDVAAAAAVKPTHAFAEDMAASAAYWIASQASRLSSNATALIGSIGTFAVVHDLSAAAAAQGIKVHVVRAGEFKGSGVPGAEVTAGQLAEMQRTIDDLNSFFLAGIESGRKLSAATVKTLNDGRVHVGERAKDLQLIDAVGTYDDAVAALEAAIQSTSTKRSISMATTAPKADDTTEEPKATEPTTPAVTTVTAPAVDPRAELKRYMADFGPEAGAQYFADGLDYSAAQSAHIKSLSDQLVAANAAKAEAEERLASMNTGEQTPIDTGAPAKGEKQAGTGWNSLFKQKAT